MIFSRTFGAVIIAVMLIIPSVIARRWERDLKWCRSGAQLYEGDFNGDGKTDLLCHRTTDGYKWIAFADSNGQFTGTSWEQGIGWCWHNNAQLHIGDFNGDGKDDMLCHDTSSGYKWIAFANSQGNFAGRTSWEAGIGWCRHAGAELHIGDFNGDGKDDMLCHDTSTGYKWIAFANSQGNFAGRTSWEAGIGWCRHASAELHIGDFNGDGKDDMLCHDTSTGYKWIAYANRQGNFADRTGWEEGIGWCLHSGSSLHIGDFNGDGKDDMLCHDTNGYKWVALANCQNNFSDRTTWQAGLGWCYHGGAVFFLGDYDGDSKTDMLCHDSNTGKKWIIYAELTIFQ
ncbi:hypothetical protein BSL78_01504 [Apostichopus japonicus]|uniref:Uncharacterized protein n=1 Tax=Stichopus japonicus TaxID=307972 RepID=A0A2G8LMV3_STIJA|nr:hypothetical protein BSL78_01504 [Apostichopus japonicus]